MGYQLEVDTIKAAHHLDMLTTPYVFNEDDATKMAQAGADVVSTSDIQASGIWLCTGKSLTSIFGDQVVAHMGLTSSGSIGARTGKSLDDCVQLIQAIRDAASKVNDQIIVLCHGGPIATPEDARYVLDKVKGVHGFFGASSMERLPVEEAITSITKEFKSVTIRQ